MTAQKIINTRKEVIHVEEDFGREDLMPANGGINPKRKKMFIDKKEIVEETRIRSPGSPFTNFESVDFGPDRPDKLDMSQANGLDKGHPDRLDKSHDSIDQ